MDVVAIVIYIAKGLFLTSGLYLAFMVLCVMGFAAWRKALIAR